MAEIPARPVSSADVELVAFDRGERFGVRYRHLTKASMGQPYRVGVALEELPPGRQTAPFHFHMLEEEHVLMLEGECTLRLGETRRPLRAGDYVCFPAGQKTGHCLVNETDTACLYLIIGEKADNEVCIYPDSDKVAVDWVREHYDRRIQMDYWDREPGSGDPTPPRDPAPYDLSPAQPVSIDAIDWSPWSHGETFGGQVKHLTKAALGEGVRYHVGVAIEELSPGRRSCPLHFHMLEEEHVYMLEGSVTLRLGEERLTAKAGDFASFPAGLKVGHCFINETDQPARYVMIGEDNPNEVCVYPDSNKVSVRWLGERYDRAAKKEYWDGE